MAYDVPGRTTSVIASADFSASQYCAAAIDSTAQAAFPAANGLAVGIVQNKPGIGKTASIMVDGISKMVAGGAIAAGSRVTVNASGQGVVAATGNRVIGIAMEAASGALAVFPLLILQEGAAP